MYIQLYTADMWSVISHQYSWPTPISCIEKNISATHEDAPRPNCTTKVHSVHLCFVHSLLYILYRDIVFHSVLHNVTPHTTVKIFPMSWPDVLCTTCTVQRRGPAHHMSHTPRACKHFCAAKLEEQLNEVLFSAFLLCEHSAINVRM